VKGVKGLGTKNNVFVEKNKKIKKLKVWLKYFFLKVKPFTPFTPIDLGFR
jgi:hypothetical protein